MAEKAALFTAVTLNQLASIRQFIEESALALGAEAAAVSEMVVAANEAVTNIILHGYEDAVGDIRVIVAVGASQLAVSLVDQAAGFDPTQVPPPNLSVPPDQRRPGGLGVHMMRKFTDGLQYVQLPSGENQLTLFKRW